MISKWLKRITELLKVLGSSVIWLNLYARNKHIAHTTLRFSLFTFYIIRTHLSPSLIWYNTDNYNFYFMYYLRHEQPNSQSNKKQ